MEYKELNSFKDVSKLSKPKLKEICRNLGIDIEKHFGKKALINLVCNALNISTSTTGNTRAKTILDASSGNIPFISELQRLKNWGKSFSGFPQLMEESVVKKFLIGAGYSETAVRKYKTLRAWEHKQGIHSVK